MPNKFKTRLEFIAELGLSKSTFYRKLREAGLRPGRGLLCPRDQAALKKALGFDSPDHSDQDNGT